MAISQSHYRFGINELAESTHGWYAAEDANPASGAIPLDTTFLLRFTLQCDATLLSNVDAEFQYRRNGGTWTQITTTTTFVKAVTPSCWANAAHTTKRLSGTGTFESSSQGCTTDGIAGGAQMDIVASGNAETECALQLLSANLVAGDLIEFRLTRDGGVLLNSYAVTPAVRIPATAALASTLAGMALSAVATLAVAGAMTATLGTATLSAAGTVAVHGQAAITGAALISTSAATVSVLPALERTLDPLTLAATGTVASAGVSAELQQLLGNVTLVADADLVVSGAAAPTLTAVTVTSEADVSVSGAAASMLDAMMVSAEAAIDVSGALTDSLALLTVTGTSSVSVSGSATLTFEPLAGESVATASIAGSLDRGLDAATLDATGTVASPGVSGELIGLFDAVTVNGAVALIVSGALQSALATTTMAGTAVASVSGSAELIFEALAVTGDALAGMSGRAELRLEALTLAARGGQPYLLPSDHAILKTLVTFPDVDVTVRQRLVLIETALARMSTLSLAETRGLAADVATVYQLAPAHEWYRQVVRQLKAHEATVRGAEDSTINEPTWRPLPRGAAS